MEIVKPGSGTIQKAPTGRISRKRVGQNAGGTPGSPDNNDTGGINFNGNHSHDVTGNTGDQGGAMGQSFSILPPYYALAYIMKD